MGSRSVPLGLHHVLASVVIVGWNSCWLISAKPPNPDNLDALDCAVSQLGVQFAVERFPSDVAALAAALQAAFHLDECANTSIAVRTSMQWPQRGGYSAQLAGPGSGASAQTNIFVSVSNGSDARGDGSRSNPFSSIQRAQVEIRATPLPDRPATTVYLREGTYYLNETLVLTAEDSGASPDAPVTWSAFPGEDVTISGGMAVATADDPLTWSSLATGVPNSTAYTALLPPGVPLNFSTLFVDGERAIWARYPNGNNKDQSGMCYSKTQRPIEVQHPCNGFATATGTTVPRPSPKPLSSKHTQIIGRYGDYPDFDVMVGGVEHPTDPHATTYTYADLFESPGGMCLRPGLATDSNSSSPMNCTPTHQCTVPCSIPGSQKYFAHFDRSQSQSDTISYEKSSWTKKSWAHPERATIRFLGQPDWGSHAYPVLAINETAGTIQLGPGGWQFADIAATVHGDHFYVRRELPACTAFQKT